MPGRILWFPFLGGRASWFVPQIFFSLQIESHRCQNFFGDFFQVFHMLGRSLHLTILGPLLPPSFFLGHQHLLEWIPACPVADGTNHKLKGIV